MMRPRAARRLVAAGCVAAVVATSCGGSDESVATEPPTESASLESETTDPEERESDAAAEEPDTQSTPAPAVTSYSWPATSQTRARFATSHFKRVQRI